MLNDFRTRALLPGLALAGLSAVAGLAQADTVPSASASVQRNDGVMSFPNVRVEIAPPPVQGAKAPGHPGLVAVIDPSTGKLVQPTAADMAGLQAPSRGAARPRTPPADASTQRQIYPAQGGVGQVLDSSYDSFMVVRRTADGGIEEVCAPGEQEALKAVASQARKPAAAASSKGELQ